MVKKRKTTEEFSEEIKELSNGKFKLEGGYINKETKVDIKCLSCNNTFNIMPVQFLSELKCKCCGIKINLLERYNINSIDDYKLHINNLTSEFEILSNELNNEKNINVIHKPCGIEQSVNPVKFIHTHFCKNCDGGQPVDFFSFCKKVADKYNTEYIVLDRYKNDFKFIHTKCKTVFEMKSKTFLTNESPCPVCNKPISWNLEKVKKEIYNKTNGEFECIDTKYKNVDTPIKIKHNVCNKSFKLSMNAFLKTPKCRVCENNYSLGEKYTKDAIVKLGYDFEKEYSFDDCKRHNILRYDFAVFNKFTRELICAVEFDGAEHYIPVFENTAESLADSKEKDEIKNKYCNENDIILIRIPFWEIDNVYKYLKKQFKINGLSIK
jgi:hypothetical protein